MPAVLLDRLPLPSLQVYGIGSLLLLGCSVHYGIQVTYECANVRNSSYEIGSANCHAEYFRIYERVDFGANVVQEDMIKRVTDVVCFMLQEPMCIWTLINMAYCCFIFVGKLIQKVVFGNLRVSEQQHMKDKFWNFVFYKFIFIFGVMNVQYMDEVVLWCGWFSLLGFLHLLGQLCKDRCEYLVFSPKTRKWTHCRVLALMFGILVMCLCLFGMCIFVGYYASVNTVAFMAAECLLVTIRTLHIIVRYAIFLHDLKHEGVWEKRSTYVYYSELVFELAALFIDFFHNLHMLVWGNIFLSMANLVIAMQLRCIFYEIHHRIKKYKNYLRIVKHMELNYPMATCDELEGDCAICWDSLEGARKLPCGHLFHNSCLCSWLEQDTSCPTCRKLLSDVVDENLGRSRTERVNLESSQNIGISGESEVMLRNQSVNHFYEFDGTTAAAAASDVSRCTSQSYS